VTDISGGKLKFTPAVNANGVNYAGFGFQVQDDGGTSAGGVNLDPTPRTLTINVTAVNHSPSFTPGGNVAVLEDRGPYSHTWATAISRGSANESGQTLDFIVFNDNNALFGAQPAIDPSGKLTFTPATNANGLATVTVKLHDSGGTAFGGSDTSAPRTFTIAVAPVNDAPIGTSGTVTTSEDTPYPFAIADFGFTDPNDNPANKLLAVKVLTLPLSGALKVNGLAFSAGRIVGMADILAGRLTFTPAANSSGPAYASFTFQVRDDGGTDNGVSPLIHYPRR